MIVFSFENSSHLWLHCKLHTFGFYPEHFDYYVVQTLSEGCQTHFHISLAVAFKELNVILGLYKCNYSFTRGKELYVQPFEGNLEADVAPRENEFDTPALIKALDSHQL